VGFDGAVVDPSLIPKTTIRSPAVAVSPKLSVELTTETAAMRERANYVSFTSMRTCFFMRA
jgi:hypothetical protein